MFFHKAMKDILGDTHTLEVRGEFPYLTFPLLMGFGATMDIQRADYYDAIDKIHVEGRSFACRESLGIIQLHRLPPFTLRGLPVSIWCHFLFRFVLNIGDSGLLNAITDRKLNFIYGIDMEEDRGGINNNSLLEIMFSKRPNRELCGTIVNVVKSKKLEVLNILKVNIDYAKLAVLVQRYGVVFDWNRFKRRLEIVQAAVNTL